MAATKCIKCLAFQSSAQYNNSINDTTNVTNGTSSLYESQIPTLAELSSLIVGNSWNLNSLLVCSLSLRLENCQSRRESLRNQWEA